MRSVFLPVMFSFVVLISQENIQAQSNGSDGTAESLVSSNIILTPDYTVAPMQDWEEKFSVFKFRSLEQNGHVLPYRFYAPTQVKSGEKYPLVLFFHGAGERGGDNRLQFFRFRTVEFWKRHPCYIIAPQCPAKTGPKDGESTWVQTDFGAPSDTMKHRPTWPMKMAMELLDERIADNPIDTSRLYVTGLSMGGFATWEILQREPNKFAAAMPVCGGADLHFAGKICKIPIWVFNGSADTTVQPRRSSDMVAALQAAGGKPKYTEYPGVGHDCWGLTYSNLQVWDWLFAQKQTKSATN